MYTLIIIYTFLTHVETYEKTFNTKNECNYHATEVTERIREKGGVVKIADCRGEQ